MTKCDTYVSELVGRHSERRALADRIERTRDSEGGGFVIRGEAGTGKTALLDFAVESAPDMRVVRVTGALSERRMPFAGLQQLCAPLLDVFDEVPTPQRQALETGLGMRPGLNPSQLLVGLAVLSLVTASARHRPVLAAIDDAQWLDRSSVRALLFAARRLAAVPASLIFAARPSATELSGLHQTTIGGLPTSDARTLLAASLPCALDEQVQELIVAETRGNPGELCGLPSTWSMHQLAGGFGLPDAASEDISDSQLTTFSTLAAPTRLLVVAAAADPTGDPELLWRAAEHLQIPAGASAAAADSGLITVGERVLFRRFVLRSAVYRSASPHDRQAVHAALAQATGRADDDRRAWHQAHATSGPDESIAAELERAAAHAHKRAGFPASAAFLERAAYLTPDPHRRSRRGLAAATHTLATGSSEATTKLLDLAESDDALSIEGQAHADMMRAVTLARTRIGETPRQLLDAARRLEQVEPILALPAYRDALTTTLAAAGLAAESCTPHAVALAVRSRRRVPSASPLDDLIDGLSALLSGENMTEVALSRSALSDFGRGLSLVDELRWLPLACSAALWSWDDQTCETLAKRWVRLARDSGALADLSSALGALAISTLMTGDMTTAFSLAREAEAVADVSGSRWPPTGAVGLAVLRRGRRQPTSANISRALEDATARGAGLLAAASTWAGSVLHNARGQHHEAFSSARRAVDFAGGPAMAPWAMAELIEAGVRSGRAAEVAQAVRDLSVVTTVAGTAWGLGVRSCSLALVSVGAVADDHYKDAIEFLSRSRARLYLARTHLLYGEWLRRENRRVDARNHLRLAFEMLESIGAPEFAERARQQLLSVGQNSDIRASDGSNLTSQELRIAIRARDGQTNTAIGRELFLSPRTVEWHLRKVFTKLGITSRRQIAACQFDIQGTSPVRT